MAARGSPLLELTNQATILYAPRREHSRKPDEFYAMVESLLPGVRRADWFAREARPGWVSIGNDVERFA
jgi:N6-adenosine-specific RNA methylase IME4